MLDQRAWDQIADVVTRRGSLSRRSPADLQRRSRTLVERNQPPDAVTVSEYLQRTGQLEAAGGLPYLARLVEDTPSAANIRAYARIVRERAMLRQLIEIGGDIAASAHCDAKGSRSRRSSIAPSSACSRSRRAVSAAAPVSYR